MIWRRRGIDLAVNLGDHVSESTPGELTLKPFRPLIERALIVRASSVRLMNSPHYFESV